MCAERDIIFNIVGVSGISGIAVRARIRPVLLPTTSIFISRDSGNTVAGRTYTSVGNAEPITCRTRGRPPRERRLRSVGTASMAVADRLGRHRYSCGAVSADAGAIGGSAGKRCRLVDRAVLP